MVTFVLPGYSKGNKDWLESTTRNLNLEGEVRPIYWDHWQEEEKKFDAKEKARLLSDLAPNMYVTIVAKSVGTLVACYMIQKISPQIKKVILCGVPINDLSEEEITLEKETVKSLGDKIIVFQNDKDPHGTTDQLKDFENVVSKPADNHEYHYFDDFTKFLKEE